MTYTKETSIKGRPSALDPMGLLRARELRLVISHPVVPKPIGKLDWEPQKASSAPPVRSENYYIGTAELHDGGNLGIEWQPRMRVQSGRAHIPIAHSHYVNGLEVRMYHRARADDSGYRFSITDRAGVLRRAVRGDATWNPDHTFSFTATSGQHRIYGAINATLRYPYETILSQFNRTGKCVCCNRVRSRLWICDRCLARVQRHAPTRAARRRSAFSSQLDPRTITWSEMHLPAPGCSCFECFGI